MTGGYDSTRLKVETSISAMTGWIAEEYTRHRASAKFVGDGGTLIGKTEIAKDP